MCLLVLCMMCLMVSSVASCSLTISAICTHSPSTNGTEIGKENEFARIKNKLTEITLNRQT